MISMEQICGEIAALEEEKPTHVTMQKLASLYTVRDHMVLGAETNEVPAVTVSGTVPMISESEFSTTIYGKDVKQVLTAVDELAETLRMMEPRLYKAFISKISTLE